MTVAQDRGLQAERTALAWNRTALAIATSGVLVLLRNVDTFRGGHNATRIALVAAVAVLAAVVCRIGASRRRQLAQGHYSGMRYLPAVGLAVIAEGVLVLMYLTPLD
ncbi:DUF202 domain-containing protein [Mycolicibacterium mucogenicum]|uniref:DUF202 domain-containing protein n=1 Tax=Mycolicibacterium mucogenicum TaxID=56689 RepID=UPI000769F546|nr:DUF202 domain-containing protein [Mycolicibacterium mucogenicum]